MTAFLATSRPQRKPDKDSYEEACLDRITHCLREMRHLHNNGRSGTLAYTLMNTELATWREALELYRKTNGIIRRRT